MLRRTICMLFFMTLLAGCVKETGAQTSNQAQTSGQNTTEKKDTGTTGDSKTIETDEFTQEELMENAPVQDENGMPFIESRDNITYEGYEPQMENPWDRYNLLDSTVKLTIEDMTGAKTFIDDDVYSFINKDGLSNRPATLPVGDRKTEVVHLYMSKTKATQKLKKDDVIVLEAVFHQPHGAIQKIVDINIIGDVVHLITKAPQPNEIWGTSRMKETNQE